MKKIVSILLSAGMCLSFAGCQSEEQAATEAVVDRSFIAGYVVGGEDDDEPEVSCRVLMNLMSDGTAEFYVGSIENGEYSSEQYSGTYSLGENEKFDETITFDYTYGETTASIENAVIIDSIFESEFYLLGDITPSKISFYETKPADMEGDVYVGYKTDIEAANALLDTTPYKMNENGSRGITLTVFATPDNEITVKSIATQLEQIGITIEYDQATATYSEDIKQQNNADFDMIVNRVTYNSDKLLMFNARYGVYPATGSVRLFNYSGLIDETLIDMMNEMELCSDTNEQYALCRDVQKYIADLCIEIPLYSENTITFYSNQKWDGWTEAEGMSIWNGYSIRYLHKTDN